MKSGFSRSLIHSLLALLVMFPSVALAWGPSGHRIVATLAERQLDAKTQTQVRHLLGVLDAASLADISNWADEMRGDPAQRELSRATSRLHYVNFSDARCHYDAAAICKNGQCVVAAIEQYARLLGNRSLSDQTRAWALRFLVHFVGDVHQPLHAGYRPDRGGNTYQIRIDGKGSNLHSVWDSKIIASRRLRWQDYVQRLERQPVSDDTQSVADWAEQSCRITRDDGVYPTGRTIDNAYVDRMQPINDLQLLLAGKRLAAILERSLGATH